MSLLVAVAIPRFSGKITTTNAVLYLLPSTIPVHYLNDEEAGMNRPEEGCHRWLYGDVRVQPGSGTTLHLGRFPARRVFDCRTAFYSLPTALHEQGLEEDLRRYPLVDRGR